ncbi:MAG: VWA domain-containing protein [Spirochaetes bacterium]|nr:MAG: VWA domain-containing protein [Spirochaetota bacterium]
MSGLEFREPLWFLLLIPWAGTIAWYLFARVRERETSISVPSIDAYEKAPSLRAATYDYLPLLRAVSTLLLVIALAGPGKSLGFTSVLHPGIDIFVALDVSDSMGSEDFEPKNRLQVAKNVLRDFITLRVHDRIGLVVFSGEACLMSPLTLEHETIAETLDEADLDTVREEGTAIGEALALAASRMPEEKGRTRIVLLLTDGVNNRGSVEPETAARMCARMGIKVYTVGIGSDEPRTAWQGLRSLFKGRHQEFDEATVKEIAAITGGKYFRASSAGVLWENVKDIDALEKSTVRKNEYMEFRDGFMPWLAVAALFFLAEIILRAAVYRKVP